MIMISELELEAKYNQLVEDNNQLKKWIDQLSEFLLINYYQTEFEDIDQWSEAKKNVIKNICF